MSDLYIHHHLGLGDMIHCNGLVRDILSNRAQHDRIFVFSKNRFKSSVEWMYRDEPRIHIVGVNNAGDYETRQVDNFLSKIPDAEFLRIGHEFYTPTSKLNLDPADQWTCDMIFYKQLNMPYSWRFSKCHWKRDLEEEERVFKKLAPSNSDYIFIHDDPARGFIIDESVTGSSLPVVRNDMAEMIFHFGLLLERAKEIHVMESSFRCMIETLDTKNTRLVFHSFRGGPWYNSQKKKWRGTSKRWEVIGPKGPVLTKLTGEIKASSFKAFCKKLFSKQKK